MDSSPSQASAPSPVPRAERDLIRLARRQVEEVRSRTRIVGPDASPGSTTIPPGAARPARGLSPFVLPGYDMGDEIHRGGQGVVYRAVHHATGRTVAVKVQHATGVMGDVERARFEREVRILAHLRHPNIVAVHDVGHVAGWTYHVMDFVDGEPLDRYVSSRALGPRETMSLMERVASAVNAAHLRGVIHRDLKPGNVLVDKSGEPRVLDFGLAKGDEFGDTVTATGQFIGSLPWASPEQVSGDPTLVDVRSDVYSLGVILYRLLTGGFPYDVSGSAHQVMSNIQHADPAPPGMGEEIDTIVLKCLRKEPERRYQSAGDLASDIGRYLRGEPIDAKRESRWYVVRKQMRRHRKATAFAAILLATFVVSSVVAWVLYVRAERTSARLLVADRIARERLRDSMISEARALRSGTAPGRRWRSLALLSEAAARADGTLRDWDRARMRDEAVAAMSLCDVTREFVPPVEKGLLSQTYAPDAAFRIGGYEDGRVKIWRVPGGEPLGELPLPDGVSGASTSDSAVYYVRVSPTGRYVVTRYGVGAERRILIWDLPSRTPLIELSPLKSPNDCDFGPNDAWVAVAAGAKIEIFSLPDGKHARDISLDAEGRLITCDRANSRLATYLASGDIDILDASTGERRARIETDEGLHNLAFSDDAARLAAGCDSSRIIVWDTKNWALQRTIRGHEGAVVDVEFGPGQCLVSWSWDGTTRLWDAASGEQLVAPLPGYCAIRFGQRGPIIGMHNGVSLWRFDAAAEYRRFNVTERYLGTSWMAISPDGRLVSVEDRDTMRPDVYEIESGRLAKPLPSVAWVHWTTSGELIAVTRAGVLRWDTQLPDESDPGRLLYAKPGIQRFILMPDEQRAVILDARNRVVLVDLVTGADIHVLHKSLPECSTLKSTIDGRWISADVWRGRTLYVWDASTGEEVTRITQEPITHTRGWFSRDARWFIVSRGPAFEWYDTTDWKPKRRLDRDDPMERLGGLAAFSPDDSLLALMMSRRRVQLVDPHTLEPILLLAPPDSSFQTHIAFSRDGRWLLACDPHGVVHVWDLRLIRRNLADMGLAWESNASAAADIPADDAGAD